jgi:hypothetical protein
MKKAGRHLPLLLLVFFVMNITQSAITSISKDEAYYWMFAQNLDWGYFDHPPMVALLIKMGTLLFDGTLGLRLITGFMMVLTLYITWLLLPAETRKKEKAVWAFILVAFAMPVFNIYGFITTPDVPLLFFSSLYLLVFMQFTRNGNTVNALKLGIVAALLMYSKYHGAFLILFSLIPYPRLLWNRYFLLAGVIGFILFLPHIHWQYQHDFISFRYHLVQRTDGFMGGKHILNYILNAFLILNPFLFTLYLFLRFFRKIKTGMPAVFSTVLWGFIIFFGFTSLRDHIEPQWIGVAVIPLTVLLVRLLLEIPGLTAYFRTIAAVSIVLILALRVGMILPLPLKTEFHTQKASYYETIRQKAGDSKVMFINSYANASKYTFYTHEPAFSYNGYDYRKNQFDIWNYEETYHHQKVFFVTGHAYEWTDSSMMVEENKLYYKHIPAFPMINKATGEFLYLDDEVRRNRVHSVTFTLKNPYDYPYEFKDGPNPLRFYLVFQTGRTRYLSELGIRELDELPPGEEISLTGFYYPVLPVGDYEVAVGIQPGLMSPLLFTEKIKVTVH